MKVGGRSCPQTTSAALIKVHWPKTLAAWLATSALMLAFAEFVAPRLVDFGDGRTILLMALIWLAASSIMVVTQIALHTLRYLKLRHYVFAYPIVVSPILIDPLLGEGGFWWTLALCFTLSPAVVVFWCMYALVLGGTPTKLTDRPMAPRSYKTSPSPMLRSALAIGLVFVGVLFLNNLVVLVAAPLLQGEERNPSFRWAGMAAPLIAAYWGAVVHFGLSERGLATLRNYIMGFLVFVLGYALFDLTFVGAAIIFVVMGLFTEGSSVISSGSTKPFLESLLGHASRYLVYSIFPATVVAGGPLLWWVYHKALPRIWPSNKGLT